MFHICLSLLNIWLPWWLTGKNPPANEGDVGSTPGSGRISGEGYGNPFQYSCWGNPMDRVVWRSTVHGGHKTVGHDLVTKQQQQQQQN